MKRDYRDSVGVGDGGAAAKGKMTAVGGGEEDVDELLAALGYKVRASDMADVAQKLQQLEMAMNSTAGLDCGDAGSAVPLDDGGASSGLADTVHYNPSDLSTWLESMLSELNAPLSSPALATLTALSPSQSSVSTSIPHFSLPVPAPAILDGSGAREQKRLRPASDVPSYSSSSSSSSAISAPEPQPVVVVDAQEAGIRLVHALMACAEAVSTGNIAVAEDLVKQISVLAASQLGAMRKVAAYFGEALARRIYRFRPPPDSAVLDSALWDMLHLHFYESGPYLKFAHFTANQAILEAFAGCRRVHVVDFGIKQGMQWPSLLQALALRPGGPPALPPPPPRGAPPAFRLTGIGPPQPDDSDALQQVGYKLAEFASTIRIDFTYRGLVACSLADLEPFMLMQSPNAEDEVVAINSIFELHRLLAHPGALEKVLATVRAVRPRIVTVVEQEARHNSGSFLDRFTEALHYYCTMFDSLEGNAAGAASGGGDLSVPATATDTVMSEVYLGRQICNVVACEGADRTERHETLSQWRGRLAGAGFEAVHLGSNAYKQASTLLALFAGGDGYRVEEKNGSLTLGWHTRPLIATSAWQPLPAA